MRKLGQKTKAVGEICIYVQIDYLIVMDSAVIMTNIIKK